MEQRRGSKARMWVAVGGILAAATIMCTAPAQAAEPAKQTATALATVGKKPNILVIWGDDIGSPEHQRLFAWHDGLQDAEHRPPCQ